MRTPRVCVLRTDGTNCDHETARAFRLGGGTADLVHINELHARRYRLLDFDIVAIPGGFSYGDDVASGKILANELVTCFRDELYEFIARPYTAMIGICNGFQVLIQAGILPDCTLGSMQAALALNERGDFECRPTLLSVEQSDCIWLKSFQTGAVVEFPCAHKEGRFWASPTKLRHIERRHLVVLRYAYKDGSRAMEYPANPNGAAHAIAGICDPSGRILGLMPHPERAVEITQLSNWHRNPRAVPHGLAVFENAIAYVKAHS